MRIRLMDGSVISDSETSASNNTAIETDAWASAERTIADVGMERIRKPATRDFENLNWRNVSSYSSLVFGAKMVLVPRLVFPRPPEELLRMKPEAIKEAFPDVLDATNWEQRPENFLADRLSYSGFKHFSAFQALLGI